MSEKRWCCVNWDKALVRDKLCHNYTSRSKSHAFNSICYACFPIFRTSKGIENYILTNRVVQEIWVEIQCSAEGKETTFDSNALSRGSKTRDSSEIISQPAYQKCSYRQQETRFLLRS